MIKHLNLIWGILIVLCFASCDMATTGTQSASMGVSVKQYSRLQQFLLGWINDNPQWENNQVVKEETDAKFMAAFVDSMSHNNMLEELSFTLEEVGKYQNRYTVLLEYDRFRHMSFNPPIWCSVIGFVSRDDVAKLTEGDEYRFTGKFRSVILDRSKYFPHTTTLGDITVGKRGEIMHLATSIVAIDSIWCVKKSK